MPNHLQQARQILKSKATPARAKSSMSFFKTKKGEYGAGDIFIGVTIPDNRKVAKQFVSLLSDADLRALLQSPIHEERLLALFVLNLQMQKALRTADRPRQLAIANFYEKNRAGVNNWDLVDVSAYQLLGPALGYKVLPKFRRWATQGTLWERRIAMVGTFHFIRKKDPKPAIEIAKLLLNDEHDLMHKAVGWMLREVGKRCGEMVLVEFLEKYLKSMPRTALRYSIERFPKATRLAFLKR